MPFAALVDVITSKVCLDKLYEIGVRTLVIQRGRMNLTISSHAIEITSFELAPSLQKEMANADLIISHAGATDYFRHANPNRIRFSYRGTKVEETHSCRDQCLLNGQSSERAC